MKKILIISLLIITTITALGLYSYFAIQAARATIEKHNYLFKETPPSSDYYEAVSSLEFFNSIGLTTFRYEYEYTSYREHLQFWDQFRAIFVDSANSYQLNRIFSDKYFPLDVSLKLSIRDSLRDKAYEFLSASNNLYSLADSILDIYPDTVLVLPSNFKYIVEYFDKKNPIEKLCKEWEEFLLFELERIQDSSIYNCCKLKIQLEKE